MRHPPFTPDNARGKTPGKLASRLAALNDGPPTVKLARTLAADARRRDDAAGFRHWRTVARRAARRNAFDA